MKEKNTFTGNPAPSNASLSWKKRGVETRLRADEEFYQAFLGQAVMGIVYADAEGRWLQVNQKFCDIVGYSRSELLKMNFQDITHPDDLSTNQLYFQRLLTGEQPSYSLEKRFLCKDGSPVWVKITVSRYEGRAQHSPMLIGFVEDIHVQKQKEQTEVGLVSQGRLVALRDANTRMEEFLGIASHELRTPLTTIKANTQLAMRRLKGLLTQSENLSDTLVARVDATHAMLERAERQIGVLNRLVSDMIDISRIQTGKLQIQLRREPCDLLFLVKSVVQEQQRAVPERTINMSLPPVEQLFVTADPDRLKQVLVNYLSNALKYSVEEQPVLLKIVLDTLPEGGTNVIASVQDHGQGLADEELSHVWECFYQSPGVRVLSGSGVGLGLGLYISQALIERHGGHVGVTSRRDEGSTFWFTLPLVQV